MVCLYLVHREFGHQYMASHIRQGLEESIFPGSVIFISLKRNHFWHYYPHVYVMGITRYTLNFLLTLVSRNSLRIWDVLSHMQNYKLLIIGGLTLLFKNRKKITIFKKNWNSRKISLAPLLASIASTFLYSKFIIGINFHLWTSWKT